MFFSKCKGVAFLKDEESDIWLLFDMFKETIYIILVIWQMILLKAT